MQDLNLRQRQTVRYMINAEALTLAALDTQLIDSVMIANLSASKITSGTISAQSITLASGGSIQSSDFVVGSAGWQILGNGNAEFGNVTVRGVYQSASSGRRIDIRNDVDLGGDGTGAAVRLYSGDAQEGSPPSFYGLWDTSDNMPAGRYSSGRGAHVDDWSTLFTLWGDNRGAATPKYGSAQVVASNGFKVTTGDAARAAGTALQIFQHGGLKDCAYFHNLANDKICRINERANLELPGGGRISFMVGGLGLEYILHDETAGAEDISIVTDNFRRVRFWRTGKTDFIQQDVAIGTNNAVGGNARGLNLPAALGPLVSRGYAAFTSGSFTGAGRYGLFQTASTSIDLVIENHSAARWGVIKYNADTTIARRIVDGVPNQATRIGPTSVTIDVAEAIGGGGFAESRTETFSGGAFRVHVASTHYNTSDERFKSDIHRASTRKHLEAIAAAPVYHWTDNDGYEQCGPMAKDLPSYIRRMTRLTPTDADPVEDVLLVSTTSLVGVLWGALQELAARVQAVEQGAPRP